MAIQSVPSLMGVTKQPYASFSGKTEEDVRRTRRHFAAIIAARGMGAMMWILGVLVGAIR